MHYEIIATLGPASRDIPDWKALLQAGAGSFRLNTSHIEPDDLPIWLDTLLPFLNEYSPHPAIILDLQGSKWRLGIFPDRVLQEHGELELIFAEKTQRLDALPVPHPDFFKAACCSTGEIILDDARIVLSLESANENSVKARIIKGGPIRPRKGITFRESNYRAEALSPKDQAIYVQTAHLKGVRFAISYVRDGAEMAHYRSLFGPSAYLIAKLERGPALTDVAAITQSADELWLCRGDLGAELGCTAMATAVHNFSAKVASITVPVMMAGQVLEHMSSHHYPTRSEVCYLLDTLLNGYRGFVLSDETAIGVNPSGACRAAAQFRAL